MRNRPTVVVEAPDDRGQRSLRVRGETVGRAWSRRGPLRLARRAGLPELDLDDPGQVDWLADPSDWPDRPWRRRTAGAVTALGLLVSAAVLFHVGTKDAVNALAYGGRVVGVVFVTASLVEVIAALAVSDYWGNRALRYSGTAVLVGVVSVTVTDLMFLITQIQGRSYTVFLWLWIGLALWAAWALWTLTQQGVWKHIPHPKGVAMSVVVSAVIGIAGLAYSQMYVPYSTPVQTPFSVTFGTPALSADGTVLHVPEHVEFRNTGSVRIYVVGTLWKAVAWPTRYTEKGTKQDTWKREFQDFDETVRHVVYEPSRMLGMGTFAGPGDRLDPGDDLSRDFVIDVPLHSGIGRVEIDADASFIRADRGKLGNNYPDSKETSWNPDTGAHEWDGPGWLTAAGSDFLRYHAKIYHSSEMLNLTHPTDYVSAWWILPAWNAWDERPLVAKGDTDPYLYVSIARKANGSEELSDSEQEPYGMNTKSRWAEMSVDQLLKAARK
ncbi:hypothetical protein [Streptomyces cinerochromogenes]|uniref:hypothetical protein n=1 Tax=Streptomyces cinerochromogenes TaxID=66422 RepID=UPI0016713BA0|nr:hypothetical protein [Streptomyces cinerochromogenes]GGS93827.1 hypothetical protein GCM10010206_65740 [Streptomyces cinerochromogenes]